MLRSLFLSRAIPRMLLPGLLLWAGAKASPPPDWQSLLGNSPFGPSAGAANGPAAGELEFRGLVQENGVYYVNLFNPATRTAQWIEVHGQAAGIQINAYDRQTGRITVTQGGRQLILPFKQARISLLETPPPPAPAAVTLAGPPASGPPAPPDAGPAREFFRNLPPDARAMIEEFRRRRAAAAVERAQPPGASGNNRRP